MSRIPKDVALAVMERAGYGCELGGCLNPTGADGFVFHHRQPRGMGGSKGRDLDVAENLLWLHPKCHEHVHAHPEWSRRYGYIVSQFDKTPAATA